MAKTIYRSDQVGNLLRPPRLLGARDAFKTGRIDRDTLAGEEDIAVVDVLARQRQIDLSTSSTGSPKVPAKSGDRMPREAQLSGAALAFRALPAVFGAGSS